MSHLGIGNFAKSWFHSVLIFMHIVEVLPPGGDEHREGRNACRPLAGWSRPELHADPGDRHSHPGPGPLLSALVCSVCIVASAFSGSTLHGVERPLLWLEPFPHSFPDTLNPGLAFRNTCMDLGHGVNHLKSPYSTPEHFTAFLNLEEGPLDPPLHQTSSPPHLDMNQSDIRCANSHAH